MPADSRGPGRGGCLRTLRIINDASSRLRMGENEDLEVLHGKEKSSMSVTVKDALLDVVWLAGR